MVHSLPFQVVDLYGQLLSSERIFGILWCSSDPDVESVSSLSHCIFLQ